MATTREIAEWIQSQIDEAVRSAKLDAARQVRQHAETRPAGEVPRLMRLAEQIAGHLER